MFIDFDLYKLKNKTVAVAVSGGSDSMALLHFMLSNCKKFGFNIISLNVEHGIRGEASIKDSLFVKNYCKENDIPLLSFSVNAPEYAKENKLSIEQSARFLRYDCFKKAISSGNCDLIATAHHKKDNAETVLLNLFRGTGLKGASGISNFDGTIIRPLLSVSKCQIQEYLKENSIPFVTDESNFSDDVTRNYLRLNVMPLIEKVFPDFESSIFRFSSLAKEEDEFLDSLSKQHLEIDDNVIKIDATIPPVLFKRACVMAFKQLGIVKDWEKAHVDSILELCLNKSGSKVTLPKGVTAINEYGKICFFTKKASQNTKIPFNTGTFDFLGDTISINNVASNVDLRSGFFVDKDKIPPTATIRTKEDGDIFTKFGGGTKSLNDYFTDKKIPQRIRDFIPLIADGNKILAIFGVAVSDLVKVDSKTQTILEIIKK